ncbi:hypothetical protein KDW_08600 [Dictyobacter vulcani]|uniref:Uncharacterized protein n=1 Tax=Dictyobacter vulcani TaxID=2607529 RepID=A0A5J4KCY5_9CHLR|nr:hypothetical protein [Dictyobacter vulcani]GER86698.1 hypothetical protein KDW_08600 [Dictyobacter vulcani]
MAVWQIRLSGDVQPIALDEGLIFIGWEKIPDLSTMKSKEDLAVICAKNYPLEKSATIANWAGQLWTFREKIQSGDLIMVPLKGRSAFAVGRITGPYQYNPDLLFNIRHTRTVKWIEKEIPRSIFEQDILRSLGSILSVCQIQRNDAENRILAILSNRKGVEIL